MDGPLYSGVAEWSKAGSVPMISRPVMAGREGGKKLAAYSQVRILPPELVPVFQLGLDTWPCSALDGWVQP